MTIEHRLILFIYLFFTFHNVGNHRYLLKQSNWRIDRPETSCTTSFLRFVKYYDILFRLRDKRSIHFARDINDVSNYFTAPSIGFS